jgi:hypothetical protein
MNEAQLMHSFNRQRNLRHVEPRYVLTKDLILDQHRHEITTRKELHEHVEEGRVLERGVQLYQPWAVRVSQDVTLCPDMCELIFLVL